ncbi:hypothetical protein CR513_45613, partial [Mucuna pruriens]
MFIDDILVYSHNHEENKENLKAMLEVLKEKRVYAKFFKYEFWLEFIWEHSRTTTKFRTFVGLARYYRRFIEEFSKIATLLTIHEKNYLTHDLELETMVFSLKIWRHYLCGVNFSNHKRMWMKFLNDYNFRLMYHPRKSYIMTDALSRKIGHM